MNKDELSNLYYHKTTEELIQMSDEICRKHYGNQVYLRGLIEFSNYCDKDCLYCGIRNSNDHVHRYRLEIDQIAAVVEAGFKAGLKTFVLQSGEDPYYSVDMLCRLLEKIKKITDNQAAVTLSCGIMTKKQFQEIRKAGCDRYLIRFETSDPQLHQYIRNGISLKRRLQTLEDLKELDFEVGSGFMVGLPGETDETRINNLLTCKKYELNMVGIGPFIPHPETPLHRSPQLPIELTIKMTALLRITLPLANLPATTAAGTLDPFGREKMLGAGANVLMPNITPKEMKKDYLLYPGKICLDESGFECIGCLSGRVQTVTKKIVMDRGDSLSKKTSTGIHS